MDAQALIVLLHSQQPDEMISFYRDVLGLRPNFELTPGAFEVGGATVIIEGHSEVKGPAKEPQRTLLNFVVADGRADQKRLMGLGVEFVRQLYEEPGVGLFATFADPDGNYCQLIEFRDS